MPAPETNLPKFENFDLLYGKGELKKLVTILQFNGTEPEVIEFPVLDDFKQICFIWTQENSEDSFVQISYNVDTWSFDYLNSTDDYEGLFGFLTSVLPSYAKQIGVKKFICSPQNETIRQMFLKVGFESSGEANDLLVSDLFSISKIEQYGQWVAKNKDPNLEPAWRKEVQ